MVAGVGVLVEITGRGWGKWGCGGAGQGRPGGPD